MQIKFLSILALLLMTSLFACNKDDNSVNPEVTTITEEEAIDLVTGALTENSAGVSQEAQDLATIAEDLDNLVADDIVFRNGPCGVENDSLVTRAYSDSRSNASYESNWKWVINCNNNNAPQTIDYQRITMGSYETPRISSKDSAESTWVLSSLLTGPNYILNGTYFRKGNQTSKVRNQSTFNSEITIEIEDLNLDKGQQRIQSGIADFTLTGTTGDGTTFTLTGDIIFLGNGGATVIVNGNTYQIQL